jgi:II/X family phage/plasmid replication protein
MIDSMGFFVIIPRETYDWLTERSILTQRIDKETGNIEFEYNNFHTHHSWNYKVMFKLDTKTWQYDIASGSPVLAEGIPHIRFEFSAPKILYGHNLKSCSISETVFDGNNALEAALLVRDAFQEAFNVSIPGLKDWYCYRLDTCANFILENEDQVRNYIRYLQKFDYPRRIKNLYEDTGIYFASRHNTLKIYCKGVEFKKHDMKRFVNELEQRRLHKEAQKILRIEVEHKHRLRTIRENLEKEKMLYPTFQGYMKIYDLLKWFDVKEEMNRIIKKFISGTETKIMRSLDVYRVLKNSLGRRQANTYYSIYTLLVTQGQKETRRQISKALYYKALSTFRDLGISIIASDIEKFDIELEKGFPADFSIEIDDTNKYYQQAEKKAA